MNKTKYLRICLEKLNNNEKIELNFAMNIRFFQEKQDILNDRGMNILKIYQ